MKSFILGLFLFSTAMVIAQSSSEVELYNIVPNSGFEQLSSTPIGWFYKGEHFTKLMKYWSSPTAASPDVFGPGIHVPAHWKAKGFGELYPHSGERMVGITTYGCKDGKPHCREYLQIQLTEPLVVGQRYYLEMWVNRLPKGLQANHLGLAFTSTLLEATTDKQLDLCPVFQTEKIIKMDNSRWEKLTSSFTAEAVQDYLVIGNFTGDLETRTAQDLKSEFAYAYYYIDDVVLKKMEPIIEVPLEENDLTTIKLGTGKIIELKNIYFDTDKWELLPRSYIELNKLLNIMHEHPNMVIEVRGHTDSNGDNNYNLYLSRKRSKAVVHFLNSNGIAKSRTRYVGFGKTQPVASNKTGDGRQLNRRVEICIEQL